MTSLNDAVPTHYVVATVKPWNIDAFRRGMPALPGTWHLIDEPNKLDTGFLSEIRPRYIFFPHWSWRVPSEIFEQFECVCFHMADVPYGRGGSPLQNLILRGHTTTVMSALRMTSEMDAGPVYLKRPLSLEGSAEEIFTCAAGLVLTMIDEIVAKEPKPVEQTGEPVIFKRRSPDQSALPMTGPAATVYDFIRMLDAPTYPKAFIDWGSLRLEFGSAKRVGSDTVEARVVIRSRSAANE